MAIILYNQKILKYFTFLLKQEIYQNYFCKRQIFIKIRFVVDNNVISFCKIQIDFQLLIENDFNFNQKQASKETIFVQYFKFLINIGIKGFKLTDVCANVLTRLRMKIIK
jgi:hypothetical protein